MNELDRVVVARALGAVEDALTVARQQLAIVWKQLENSQLPHSTGPLSPKPGEE